MIFRQVVSKDIAQAEAELIIVLGMLGTDPQEIADRLTKAGYAGHRSSCNECPIARYLLDLGFTEAEVTFDDVTFYPGHEYVVVSYDHPGKHNLFAVLQFVRNFDAQLYPQLDVIEQKRHQP